MTCIYMRRIVFAVLLISTLGCAPTINSLVDTYSQDVAAVRNFAGITAKDWLFGSGMVAGLVPRQAMPEWFWDELQRVDEWAEAGEFSDWQLGYITTLRLRLFGPLSRAAIESYAPGVLGIREIGMVLGFVGL